MWALLKLNPQQQDKYLEYVHERLPDVETYYPRYDRVTRPAGKRQPISLKTAVWPGYIFVVYRITYQRLLLTLPVRAWFIRLAYDRAEDMNNQVSLMPDWVIQGIRRMEANNDLVHQPRKLTPYTRGTDVLVHLPVRTIRATIIRVAGSSALVDTDWSHMRVPLGSVALPPRVE